MGRAPCCEKMGLKKGPWTKEEDVILIDYINQHGHANWRALPKKAGLLRCGKSCRLRWTNYLRPDIKRGNFTKEEEQTIIYLHQLLGNRWSAIAARLPGRTDNEIKNVWHTNLKKRLTTKQPVPVPDPDEARTQIDNQNPDDSKPVELFRSHPNSPPQSSSTASSTLTINHENQPKMYEGRSDTLGYYPELDEDFWLDVVSSNHSEKPTANGEDGLLQIPLSPVHAADYIHGYGFKLNQHDDLHFWRDLFTRAEELLELPEF